LTDVAKDDFCRMIIKRVKEIEKNN